MPLGVLMLVRITAVINTATRVNNHNSPSSGIAITKGKYSVFFSPFKPSHHFSFLLMRKLGEEGIVGEDSFYNFADKVNGDAYDEKNYIPDVPCVAAVVRS